MKAAENHFRNEAEVSNHILGLEPLTKADQRSQRKGWHCGRV
jgi:hypothetical protein